MAEAPNPTPAPSPTPEPLGNDPTVRNPDGSIKDPAANPNPSSNPEPKPEPKAGDEPKPAPKPPAEGAPEKYEAFKAPEGYELDAALVEKASPLFKELGLNQAQAQKLIDFYGDAALKAGEAPFEAFEATQKEWRDSVIADPALGNGKDGLKDEVKAAIGRVVDSLPHEIKTDFQQAMTLTGAGNNPAFVKAFYNLAQRLNEGSLVRGGGPSPEGQSKPGAPRSAASALFPNLPSANG